MAPTEEEEALLDCTEPTTASAANRNKAWRSPFSEFGADIVSRGPPRRES